MSGDSDSTSEAEGMPLSWWGALRASLSGRHFDFTSGPLGKAVLVLAVPMVLELAMESLFAICDIFWVSKLGPEAVAAVGLTEAVLTLYYAVAIGLSMAVTATVARRVGEKRHSAAAEAGAQGVMIGLGVGVVTGAVCWLIAPAILGLMGADEATLAIGSGYTRVTLGMNAVVMLLFLNNAILRGAGDASLAMRALWIGNGINLVLDPMLIFGVGIFPELGVTGAAVATVCGRGVALGYQVWVLCGGSSRVVLDRPAWRIDMGAMLKLLRVSVGGIAQMGVATTSWVVLMRLMAEFGSVALAGYTIGIRVLIFTLLPSWGMANAAATLVGQNLGAGKPERAERAVLLVGFWNMVFLVATTVGFLFFAPQVAGLFTGEEGVRAVAAECLRIITYGYIFYAWGMVLVQAFNGAGDTMTPTWLNVGCFWVLQLPLAWWLVRSGGKGPEGVFWSVAISESLLAVAAWVVFRRGSWKGKEC